MTKFAISAKKMWAPKSNSTGAALLCPGAREVCNVQRALKPPCLLLALPSDFVSAVPWTRAICPTSPIISRLRGDPAGMQQCAMQCLVLQPHCCRERPDAGSHQPSRGTRVWPGPPHAPLQMGQPGQDRAGRLL